MLFFFKRVVEPVERHNVVRSGAIGRIRTNFCDRAASPLQGNHRISGLVEEASRLPQAKVGNTASGGGEEEGMTSGDGGGGESFTS